MKQIQLVLVLILSGITPNLYAQIPVSDTLVAPAFEWPIETTLWSGERADSLQATVDFPTEILQSDTLQKRHALVRVADAMLYTYAAPLRWNSKQWAQFGGIAAGTVALTTLDEPVQDLMQHSQGHFGDQLEPFGYHYGKPHAGMIATGGFYLYGLAFKNEWAKETGIALGASYATTGLLQAAMKQLFGRARPATGEGPYHFRPFSNDPSFSSFPSGHVQMAMVTSTVLAHRVDQTWLKGLFYAGAGVTIWSRMYQDAHWLSDVTFGSIISYFCATKVMQRLEANRYENAATSPVLPQKKISWQFQPTYQTIGVIGTF